MVQTSFKKNAQKENQAQNSNNTSGKCVAQKKGRIWEYDKEEKLWEDIQMERLGCKSTHIKSGNIRGKGEGG